MNKEKLKGRLLDAFSEIEVLPCEMCGAFLQKKEYEEGEGVCFKHWD